VATGPTPPVGSSGSNWHGNVAAALLAMMLGAFVLLDRGRWLSAGAILGFAAMLKALPATAIGYLI